MTTMARITDELKGLPAFCVRRPVSAIVLNLLVVIAGLAAILAVDVRELPSTDRPVVTIRTTYSGATPETVDTTVTSVLEGAAARTPGVSSISSRSSYGASRITVEFSSSVDIDTAATDLRNAIADLRVTGQEVLPDGVEITLLSEAALLEETSSGMALVFIFAIVIVFLVLAAQFESFVSSIIILVTIPTGVAAAVMAIGLTGGTINVYSQIGIILLVGIMAKNGILIVEFANQLHEQGQSVRDAIEGACMRRLRPVMMTMISTVFGGLPLILAFGAGAEARMALGWTIVGGLGFATVSTLFLTPVAYNLLAGFSKSRNADEAQLIEELQTSGKEAGTA